MPMVREAWERSLDLLTCIATAVGSEVPYELSLVAFGSLDLYPGLPQCSGLPRD